MWDPYCCVLLTPTIIDNVSFCILMTGSLFCFCFCFFIVSPRHGLSFKSRVKGYRSHCTYNNRRVLKGLYMRVHHLRELCIAPVHLNYFFYIISNRFTADNLVFFSSKTAKNVHFLALSFDSIMWKHQNSSSVQLFSIIEFQMWFLGLSNSIYLFHSIKLINMSFLNFQFFLT